MRRKETVEPVHIGRHLTAIAGMPHRPLDLPNRSYLQTVKLHAGERASVEQELGSSSHLLGA